MSHLALKDGVREEARRTSDTMGDSDDDWDVDPPIVLKKAAVEEEDLTVAEMAAQEAAHANHQTKVLTEDERRKEEEVLANKLAYALQANESADEKRRREKAQIEAADNELTNELMGGVSKSASNTNSAVSAVVGASLKNKQDHVNFAITVSNKMKDSTQFCVSAFYKEINKRIKGKLSLDCVNEIIESLSVIRDDLKSTKETNEVSKESNKKSAKEQKRKQKEHSDVFGGNYYEEEEYGDEYAQLEEDYMF